MPDHPEFEKAGKQPGLQVWVIKNMDLSPVPKEFHGEFFSGDSYIVLNTTTAPSYDIHTWRGSKASQDEYATAAILMTQLDDYLNKGPRQFTEYEGEESKEFMSYFKHGVKYREGGHASGFNDVETNFVDVSRLFHVKGRRQIRAREVKMDWTSFNKGDCFIIDLGEIIYHWSGSESNFFERLKSTEVANDIRDNERRGRARVERIQEGEEPEHVTKVLGQKPDLSPATSDKPAEKPLVHKASLHLISDATGSMKTSVVAEESPFKQDMLSQDECYILDNGEDKKIYVWKGPRANAGERKQALELANKFIKDNDYCETTQIQILPAGAESTLFKQFFENWLDKDETTGVSDTYTIGSIAQVEPIPFDASSLHSNRAMAAQHGMVDDGSGKTQIWRVEGGEKVLLDEKQHGQFFGGDCYLILYSYNTGGREKHIIYTWQGLKCSRDELAASAFLTVHLDDSMGGVATQVRVTQGKEPAHLMSLFRSRPMIIHRGGTCRHGGDCTPPSTRLFHIRQGCNKLTRAVEVEPVASSLNTNDNFVLKSPNSVYIWMGQGSTPEEKAAAQFVVDLLGGTPTEVKETEEPDDFWTTLGGKAKYQTSVTLRNAVYVPRLFACSNKTGRLIAEEVPGELMQSDLATDDVMILDIRRELFIWLGNEANEAEVKGCVKIAYEYLQADRSGRSGLPITLVKQGDEPPTFTGWFQAWDPDMWDKARAECMHHTK